MMKCFEGSSRQNVQTVGLSSYRPVVGERVTRHEPPRQLTKEPGHADAKTSAFGEQRLIGFIHAL